MLKQAKFRGFSLETNIWHYGYGWFEVDYTEEFKQEKGLTDKACLYTESGPVEVELESIGQCIELPDADGKDIYEGDLMEVTNGATDDYKRFLAQVHRHASSFNLCVPIYVNTIIAQPVPYHIRKTGKVIGTIFEHKQHVDDWKKRIDEENVNRI